MLVNHLNSVQNLTVAKNSRETRRNGRTDRISNGRMDGRTDGRTDAQTNGPSLLKKCVPDGRIKKMRSIGKTRIERLAERQKKRESSV